MLSLSRLLIVIILLNSHLSIDIFIYETRNVESPLWHDAILFLIKNALSIAFREKWLRLPLKEEEVVIILA